jgi:hypothetical protein
MKLSQVVLKDNGIFPPGGGGFRKDTFRDAEFDLIWNEASHCIAIRDRKSGAVRFVDQSAATFWDEKPKAAEEQKQPQQQNQQGHKR